MRKDRIEIKCFTCQAPFFVAKHRAGGAKYCSKGCKPFNTEATLPSLDLRKCPFCGKLFEFVEGVLEKFCSRECYSEDTKLHKKCKDCGHERCKEHSRQKTARWRKNASKKELKARSMQTAFRHASGKRASLSLPKARSIINNPPDCPYCHITIPFTELSIDHIVPISRGGSNDLDNLIWVDLSCNLIKGNLTKEEFMILLGFMDEHPELKKHLTTRLKAGSGFIFRRKIT